VEKVEEQPSPDAKSEIQRQVRDLMLLVVKEMAAKTDAKMKEQKEKLESIMVKQAEESQTRTAEVSDFRQPNFRSLSC
jgi:hypothetical protein